MKYLEIPGKPIPQGSMKAFAGRGAAEGKAFTTASNAGPLQRYRNDIRNAYGNEFGAAPRFTGPVELYVTFYFQRPRSHYNANGDLKDGGYKDPAPTFVTKKPDLDKLCRSVGDALTEYAYDDDDQIVSLNAIKKWADRPSTELRIIELPTP